jgi:hypothetical protein
MTVDFQFLDNQADEDEGLNDAGIETFRETPFSSAAKEAGQNSLDAGSDRPVIVEIDQILVDQKKISGIQQLSRAIDACLERVAREPDEKEEDFFRKARSVLDEQKLKVLQIADYNTCGLEGPSIKGKPFFALLKSSGVSRKQKGAPSLGSFGIGKNASFAISDLQTVFYSTVYKDVKTDQTHFLAQGKAKLVSHDGSNGQPKKATGYWGLPDYKEITDPDLVPDWMRRTRVGTSVFALGFREEENWQFRVAAAVIKTFFVAIHDGDMLFKIDKDLIIDSTTINESFQDQRIIDAAEASHSSRDFQFAKELYQCLVSTEAVEHTIDIKEFGTTHLGKVKIRILKRMGMPKRVGIIRKGMMITDNLEKFDSPLKYFPNYSEFIALVQPISEAGTELLKKLENPAHDSFSSERITDPTKQNEAFRSVKRLGKEIRNTIKEAAYTIPEDVEAITEMAEFFADYNQLDESGDGESAIAKLTYELNENTHQTPRPRGSASGTSGAGSGIGGGGGGGTGGSGSGANSGNKGGKSFSIANSRYISANGKKTILVTPLESGRASIRIFAAGMSSPEPLEISTTSQGIATDGAVMIQLTKGNRTNFIVTLTEAYEGPIEIIAQSIEVRKDADN